MVEHDGQFNGQFGHSQSGQYYLFSVSQLWLMPERWLINGRSSEDLSYAFCQLWAMANNFYCHTHLVNWRFSCCVGVAWSECSCHEDRQIDLVWTWHHLLSLKFLLQNILCRHSPLTTGGYFWSLLNFTMLGYSDIFVSEINLVSIFILFWFQ